MLKQNILVSDIIWVWLAIIIMAFVPPWTHENLSYLYPIGI